MGRVLDLGFGMTGFIQTSPYLKEGDTLTYKELCNIVTLCKQVGAFIDGNIRWYLYSTTPEVEPLSCTFKHMEYYVKKYISWVKTDFRKGEEKALTFTVSINSDKKTWCFTPYYNPMEV